MMRAGDSLKRVRARALKVAATWRETRAILRRILLAQRWPEGYVGYDEKRGWRGGGMVVTLDAKDLPVLFAFAGIVPDAIKPKGACADCKFSVNGKSRGWDQPCAGCRQPLHDKFEPRKAARKARAR